MVSYWLVGRGAELAARRVARFWEGSASCLVGGIGGCVCPEKNLSYSVLLLLLGPLPTYPPVVEGPGRISVGRAGGERRGGRGGGE